METIKLQSISFRGIFLVFAIGFSAGNGHLWAQMPYAYPFRDPDLPTEQRIDNILSLMTLDEKIDCLGTNPSVPRLGIKGTGHMEGLHGLAAGGPAHWNRGHETPTTQFPQSYGLGETWDPELIREVGAAEGLEARYIVQSQRYHSGGLVIRAPNTDLGRDPRWGRTEECYGEDPFLTGTMAVAMIRGLQGDDPRYWQCAALMKHFLANSNENTRERSSSNFDDRLLREYYSAPFRMGVELGGSRAFMASYNAWNGVPMMVNPILKNMAVLQWGQNGIICTDGGALGLLIKAHQFYPDLAWGAAATIKSGIGQFLDKYKDPVKEALKDSLLTEKDIDAVLRGNFRVMIRLGLLDPPARVPYASIGGGEEPWLSEAHKSLALKATLESIVLLKNEGSLLPLDKSNLHSVAVIGPFADTVFEDWYSGTPPYAISPLQGIKAWAGPGIKVGYAASNNGDSAAALAKSSDVAIVIVGNHPTCNAGWAKCPDPGDGKEAVDRQTLSLSEEELVKVALRANPRTIVVLLSSFPYAIPWSKRNAPAIVHMTHNSQEEGNALAEVLFGAYNPGGRLTQTWPATTDDLPPMMDYDIRRGRTYQYTKAEPLFPFGFGLSYTTFSYSNEQAELVHTPAGDSVRVHISVTNTGKVDGDDVVEVYVRHLHSNVARPQKELKAFKRIKVKSKQTRVTTLSFPVSGLAYWDTDKGTWVLEAEDIEVTIGRSSRDAVWQKILHVSSGR